MVGSAMRGFMQQHLHYLAIAALAASIASLLLQTRFLPFGSEWPNPVASILGPCPADAKGYSLTDLQMAGTRACADTILKHWAETEDMGEARRSQAAVQLRGGLLWDYALIASYTLLFVSLLLALRFHPGRPVWPVSLAALLRWPLVAAAFVAAGADVAENNIVARYLADACTANCRLEQARLWASLKFYCLGAIVAFLAVCVGLSLRWSGAGGVSWFAR
jgi:hypothetical protein